MRRVASCLLWPVLFGLCLLLTAVGLDSAHPTLAFNAIYLGLALSLWGLERWLPHEPQWLRGDGEMPADLAHTLLSKGIVQLMVVLAALIGLGGRIEAGPWWPDHWPMPLQVTRSACC